MFSPETVERNEGKKKAICYVYGEITVYRPPPCKIPLEPEVLVGGHVIPIVLTEPRQPQIWTYQTAVEAGKKWKIEVRYGLIKDHAEVTARAGKDIPQNFEFGDTE